MPGATDWAMVVGNSPPYGASSKCRTSSIEPLWNLGIRPIRVLMLKVLFRQSNRIIVNMSIAQIEAQAINAPKKTLHSKETRMNPNPVILLSHGIRKSPPPQTIPIHAAKNSSDLCRKVRIVLSRLNIPTSGFSIWNIKCVLGDPPKFMIPIHGLLEEREQINLHAEVAEERRT